MPTPPARPARHSEGTNEMLTLVVDNSRKRHSHAAEETLRYCDAMLDMRRQQACEDLVYYSARSSMLRRCDPEDLTGLHELYELHVDLLTDLIAHIDADRTVLPPACVAAM